MLFVRCLIIIEKNYGRIFRFVSEFVKKNFLRRARSMIKLHENGVYLLNGTEIIEDNQEAAA